MNNFKIKSKILWSRFKSDDGRFKGSAAPMVDMGTYYFKILNTRNITPE